MKNDVGWLSLYHTADSGAARCGDAEEVGAGWEVGEVEVAVGFDAANFATRVVEDVDTDYLFAIDGDNTSGWIRIDGERQDWVGRVDADLIDGEEEDDDTVAPCLSAANVEILSAFGIGGAIPCVATNSGVGDGVADAVVDGED